MSEDQTHAPTKQRRQQARQRGQVARSPELTAAAGLLAALVLLGVWGDDLVRAMVGLIRAPLTEVPLTATDAGAVVERFRSAAGEVAVPLGAILGGVTLAIVGRTSFRSAVCGRPACSLRIRRGSGGASPAVWACAVGVACGRW